jgi:hypothetical protein
VSRNVGTENSDAKESPKGKNTTQKYIILKPVTEGKMEGTRGWGKRHKQLLDNVKANK